MDVRDHGQRREPNDPRQRVGVLDLRHRARGLPRSPPTRARRSARSSPRRRASSSTSSTGPQRARRRRSRRRRRGSARDCPSRSSVETCLSSPLPPPGHSSARPTTILTTPGARCRSRAGHAPRRLPLGHLPDAGRRASSSGGRRSERAVIPLSSFAPSRSLRRAARGVRDPDRHRVRRGDPRMRRPATAPRLDRRRRSSRRTRACTSSAGRTRSRRGTRPGSRAGSTVSGAAGSSPPESKFHRRSGASKAALLGLVRHLRRQAATRSSTSSGRRRTSSRSAPSSSGGPNTTAGSDAALAFPTGSTPQPLGMAQPLPAAQESRPMSFVRPITNRSSTSPIPTIETRS